MMCAIMHMMAPCVLTCQARWQKRKKGPTVAVPDTQPQIVQGEILIVEKSWNPDHWGRVGGEGAGVEEQGRKWSLRKIEYQYRIWSGKNPERQRKSLLYTISWIPDGWKISLKIPTNPNKLIHAMRDTYSLFLCFYESTRLSQWTMNFVSTLSFG